MKKSLVVIMLLGLLVTVYAQDGNLKKQTYLRFGLSVPTWKFSGAVGKSDWPDNTRRVGAIFETGSIYMLNSMKIAPGMRLGINVDYLSLQYNRVSVESLDYNAYYFFVGSKIGPSFSYSPVDRLVFDTYIKFNPVWAAGAYRVTPDIIDDGNDFYLGFMGLKYSVGLNVRYSILMVGCEINPGFAKMKKYDDEEKKFVSDYHGNMNDNGEKTAVPVFNVTVGLSF